MINALPLSVLEKVADLTQRPAVTVIHDLRALPAHANDNGSGDWPKPPQNELIVQFAANDNPTCTIKIGDCLDRLRELPNNSIDLCVTSPPYFQLRDYGVEGQIGQENCVSSFISNLVEVFREVWRVLKPSGNLYINLGDTYSGRQMLGLPWKLAFALQDDGWLLYNDLIWDKISGKPESANGRFTRQHEHVFHFTKTKKNYFDHATTFRKGRTTKVHARKSDGISNQRSKFARHSCDVRMQSQIDTFGFVTRRMGTVIAVRPNGSVGKKYGHFASYPPGLIEPLIVSSCPPGGTVLDPFGGSGTTGIVATRTGRSAVLIELNPDYALISEKRVRTDPWTPSPPLFASNDNILHAEDRPEKARERPINRI